MSRRVETYDSKKKELYNVIRGLGSLVVGLSGGVDSTLLLAIAKQVLGTRVMAVTAASPTHPEHELENAVAIAGKLGVRHMVIDTHEMEDPDFTDNGPDRCYYCKRHIFKALQEAADDAGMDYIAHGANQDDLSDHRPGFKAAQEMGVVAPLSQAGFTKSDVRRLAKEIGLPNWSRPAMACLATRVPYGVALSQGLLIKIAKAEELVRQAGVTQCRVRQHDDLARIEIPMEEVDMLMGETVRQILVEKIIDLGYNFVCIDMEGFESGKMNRVL